jgi:hypothetical protein
MAINIKEISQSALSELHQVTDWIENRTVQESENIEQRNNEIKQWNDEKTRGDEI